MHHSDIERPQSNGFIVLDYGSQYTLLIARRLREIGVYAEVVDGLAANPPKDFTIEGIILSGGPDSVSDLGSRRIPSWIFDLNKPIMGICYGMQLLVNHFGGELRSGTSREYGKADLILNDLPDTVSASTFKAMPQSSTVWMSHGDDLAKMPNDFSLVATTEDGVAAAICHNKLPILGLQFHPEVEHSEKGMQLLTSFVRQICSAEINWDAGCMMESTLGYIRNTVKEGHVLVACSGGVDSTVAAALLAKAIGPDRVTAVFCDHGLMRKNEVPWVSEQLKVLGLKHIEVLNSKKLFFDKLKGISDPEQKRKIIGLTFIEEFEKFAKQHSEFTHLGQGTLYPDVIESAGHGAGSKVIKSHHNVGGLPEKLALDLVEPLRYLFKDEVRVLGERLGLPHDMVHRHPFPGPGLAVRILGDITEEKVAMLQEADDIFIQALRKHGYYEKIWQAFAVLLPVKSVGVMGDNRTYQKTIALRAVNSSDAMTAGVGDLTISFLTEVSSAIVKKVDGVNRVVYDVTTKPPATIEWE